MKLKIHINLKKTIGSKNLSSLIKNRVFSKDYVDFLNEAGWRLEKKFPSNNNHYSDLLEDTDWKPNKSVIKSLKHYRRDLDALS
tara:strand:- start:23 stop:274 length:252 start_codon:yes stop_codon:yes gene_type:complete